MATVRCGIEVNAIQIGLIAILVELRLRQFGYLLSMNLVWSLVGPWHLGLKVRDFRSCAILVAGARSFG